MRTIGFPELTAALVAISSAALAAGGAGRMRAPATPTPAGAHLAYLGETSAPPQASVRQSFTVRELQELGEWTETAAILERKGDYASAEPLYRRALTFVAERLGETHADTCAIKAKLASNLSEQGRSSEAAALRCASSAFTATRSVEDYVCAFMGTCLGEEGDGSAPATKGFSLSRKPASPSATAVARAARSSAAMRRPSAVSSMAEPSGTRGVPRSTLGLPAFPWPAPRPVQQHHIPSDRLGGPNQTLDQLVAGLQRSLHRANAGYQTGLFSGPPGGFVMLTRMERIQQSALPFDDARRFTREGNPRASFWQMLNSLLKEQPGYFRTIAFVVTDSVQISDERSVADIPVDRIGEATRLPRELGRSRLGERGVYVLVYTFQRSRGRPLQFWSQGAPSAFQHLKASGVAAALGLT